MVTFVNVTEIENCTFITFDGLDMKLTHFTGHEQTPRSGLKAMGKLTNKPKALTPTLDFNPS